MLHRVTFKIKVLVGIKCVFDKAYYYLRSSNIVFYQDLLTLQLLSIHYVGLTTYKNLKALSNILYNYTLAVQFPLCWIWILDNESVFWVIRICGMVSAYFLWCRVSKAHSNEYTEKIEGIEAKISTTEQSTKQVSQDPSLGTSDMQILSKEAGESVHSPRGLRHPTEDRSNDTVKLNNIERSVKLDSAAQAHIEKHRKLQDDLTDEMVGLARQLKESTLMMSQSIQNTEKILDSTEKAVEQSLARTGHVNSRAMEVYSQTFKTSCATWLAVFVMVCIFIMVVLLIRVTRY
ncbi:uncharacterized protein LOC111406188 isoform X3 [Olea europaea var. sylvestris]|uniref:uncharacterized protein LOC111406188 isoform X3 n=1 Tax=Olea europaea var. sylvestris TaxID=158386 RepID=UPI000C1CCD98|nr:uncharacterized protein LOC111406188 isoform X3 [Olea europaea var. sylvestris]